MDELFTIEKNIGEIAGVIGLQFNIEKTVYVEEKWEVFEAPVVEEKKPKEEDHYTGSSNIANKAVPQKPIPAQN